MNNDDIKSGLAELENIFIDYKTKSANGTKKVLNGDFCDWNVNNKGKQLLRYIADSVRGRVLPELKKNVFSGMTKNSFDKKGEVPIKPYSRYDFMSKEEKEKFGVTLYASYNFGMPEAESFEFAIKLDVEENNPPEKALIENFKELEDFIGKKGNIKAFFEWEARTVSGENFNIPKIVTDITSLKEKPEEINRVIEKCQDALVILKACYKYILSGNKDMLDKIEYLIRSMKCVTDPKSGLSLSTTMIALDDLIFDDCKQIVLTGAPGTGKTYSAQEYIKWQLMTEYLGEKGEDAIAKFNTEWDESENDKGELADRWRMVQFHPSFDYTDFVEGLRPIEIDNKMQFKRMDGIFKEFCRKVAEENGEKDPSECPKRFFLIDEINRADLSKVFGELMFCLEEDYRGKNHTIKTQYSNLDTYFKDDNKDDNKTDVFKKGFYIPENVIIIGTMNDIDRSVDTFDFALRRRFRWVNVEVNETLLTTTFLAMNKKNDSLKTEEEISGFVKSVMDMNSVFSEDQFKRIFKTPKDYYVGPAYFKGLFKNDTKDAIWRNKIEPLLREYVRGRIETEDFIDKCKGGFIPESKKAKAETSDKKTDMTSNVIEAAEDTPDSDVEEQPVQ